MPVGNCSWNFTIGGGGGGGGGGEGFFFLTVRYEEPKYKVENLKYKKLEIMQPRIKNKSELPAVEYTILDQFTRSFSVEID